MFPIAWTEVLDHRRRRFPPQLVQLPDRMAVEEDAACDEARDEWPQSRTGLTRSLQRYLDLPD